MPDKLTLEVDRFMGAPLIERVPLPEREPPRWSAAVPSSTMGQGQRKSDGAQTE